MIYQENNDHDLVEIFTSEDSANDSDSGNKFTQVRQWNMDCFVSTVVRLAKDIPQAPTSLPRCLSPPLHALVPSWQGKQDYHDAVAKKTGKRARKASPPGGE